jgi:serine phosphatase RsbU (regulator of sigma subunit)
MSQAIALLEYATQREDRGLEEILAQMDQALRQLFSQRDFLTLTLLEWEESGSFRLARAGHPPAMLLRGGEAQDINPGGRGLGLRPQGSSDWQIHQGTLAPREWMVLYSDGLTEAMNQQGELYGEQRMRALLQKVRGTGSPRAACEALFRDVAGFEAQNRDDRTLFILAREHA